MSLFRRNQPAPVAQTYASRITWDVPPSCPVCRRFLPAEDIHPDLVCHCNSGTTSPSLLGTTTSAPAGSEWRVPAAGTRLALPANPSDVIRRLTSVVNLLGVSVEMGVPPDSLSRGYFAPKARQVVVYGGYSDQDQCVELAHLAVHVLQRRGWWQRIDCEDRTERIQPYEQVARSTGVLLARRLGWPVDTEDSIWDASLSDEHRAELQPRVEFASQELFRGIGLL